MSLKWHLLTCECGHSYGRRAGAGGKCTRCGSSNHRKISEFGDSRLLADAVSNANTPKHVAIEISSRILSKNKISRTPNSEFPKSRSAVVPALYQATDDDGILRLHSLKRELQLIGLDEDSWQSIIGEAEMEGILIRIDSDSWSWVQQSS